MDKIGTVHMLRTDKLIPNPDNPRKNIGDIDELDMKKRRIIRDLPLSLTLSEDEDRKLDQLVVMLGADTRSDAVRRIITSMYDAAPSGGIVKNGRYPLEGSRKRGIAKQLALVAESICDSYCRFPRETASEDELQIICVDCPVNYML